MAWTISRRIHGTLLIFLGYGFRGECLLKNQGSIRAGSVITNWMGASGGCGIFLLSIAC